MRDKERERKGERECVRERQRDYVRVSLCVFVYNAEGAVTFPEERARESGRARERERESERARERAREKERARERERRRERERASEQVRESETKRERASVKERERDCVCVCLSMYHAEGAEDTDHFDGGTGV